MAENFEDMLSCQICLEDFHEDGDLIPRLLPCSHTLCQKCLIQLLGGGGTLTCPECRTKHAAPSMEKTFPQNKYLLGAIKKKSSKKEKESEEVPRCPDHGKELTLFCKETQCQTLICTVCMTRNHKKHDVVDVEENRKEELATSLTSAIESVSFKKEKIASTQIPVDRKNDECLETLRDEKNKILDMVRDKYDSMIREATNQKEESRREMTSLEENLPLLNNIKIHIDEETVSPKDVKNYQETLDSIKQHTEQIPSEPRVNVYMELTYQPFRDKEWLLGQLCGKLQSRNHSADRQTQNPFGMPVQQPSPSFNFGRQKPSTVQPPVFSLKTVTGSGLSTAAQQPSSEEVLEKNFQSLLRENQSREFTSTSGTPMQQSDIRRIKRAVRKVKR